MLTYIHGCRFQECYTLYGKNRSETFLIILFGASHTIKTAKTVHKTKNTIEDTQQHQDHYYCFRNDCGVSVLKSIKWLLTTPLLLRIINPFLEQISVSPIHVYPYTPPLRWQKIKFSLGVHFAKSKLQLSLLRAYLHSRIMAENTTVARLKCLIMSYLLR